MHTTILAYTLAVLAVVSLTATPSHAVNITIDSSLGAANISENVTNTVTAFPGEEINILLSMNDGQSFSASQLTAMFPAVFLSVGISLVGTGSHTRPTTIDCGQTLVNVTGSTRPTFAGLKFENCLLDIRAYAMRSASSTNIMANITMLGSAMSLELDTVAQAHPQLMFEDVEFLHTTPMSTSFAAGALFIDTTPLNDAGATNHAYVLVLLHRCHFNDIHGMTPLLITHYGGTWPPTSGANVSVDVWLEESTFQKNLVYNSSFEYPAGAVKVYLINQYVGSRFNLTFTGCEVSFCGSAPSQHNSSIAAIDLHVENSTNLNDLLYLKLEGKTRLHNNLITPMRVRRGVAQVTLLDTTVSQNTVLVPTDSEAIGHSAGVSIDVESAARVEVAGCSFEENQLNSTSEQMLHGVGGSLQILISGTARSVINVIDTNFTKGSVLNLQNSLLSKNIPANGGGVAVVFEKNASENIVDFSGCLFVSNSAVRGGGMSVSVGEAVNNVLTISCHSSSPASRDWSDPQCGFVNNNASAVAEGQLQADDQLGNGGAVSVHIGAASVNNFFLISGQVFYDNGAADGGGLHIGFHGNDKNTNVSIVGCFFVSNTAIVGAGMSLLGSESLTDWSLQTQRNRHIMTRHLHFEGSKPYFAGAMAVIDLEFDMEGNFIFISNLNSALYLRNSLCNFYCNATYEDNQAHAAAGVFSVSSTTRLYPGAIAVFRRNIALAVGGGVYAYTDGQTVETVSSRRNSHCFLVYADNVGSPQNWNVTISFVENVAGLSGSAIYMNSLSACSWLNGEDTALNNSIEWLSNNSRDNYIVPDLYTGYHGSSVYQASPGGTLQLLSLPLSYFWDSRYIQDLYKNFDEIILCWDPAQWKAFASTDAVILHILEPQQANHILSLHASDRCEAAHSLFVDQDTHISQATVGISAGLRKPFNAIACDALGNSIDVMLYIAGAEPSACDSLWRKGNPHSCARRGGAVEVEQGAHIDNTNVRLDSYTLKTEDVRFFSRTENRPPAPQKFIASLVGGSNLVSRAFNVKFTGCQAGYKFNNRSTQCQYQCTCVRDIHKNDQDLQVRSCHDDAIVLSNGYWADQSDCNKNATYDGIHDQCIDVQACPLGFCQCTPYGTTSDGDIGSLDCAYYNDKSNKQCSTHRTGRLCGNCTNGTASLFSFYQSVCTSECWDPNWSLPLLFVAQLVIVSIALYLEVSLSGDIRALLLFFAILPMLFYENDYVLQELSAGKIHGTHWERYQYALLVFLRLAKFEFPVQCWYKPTNSIRSVVNTFIPPAMMLGILFMFHLLALCCRCSVSPRKSTGSKWNIFHGTLFISYIIFQWLLEPSALLLRNVNIGGEWYFYYDATIAVDGDSPLSKSYRNYRILAICCILFAAIFCLITLLLAVGRKYRFIREAENYTSALTLGLGNPEPSDGNGEEDEEETRSRDSSANSSRFQHHADRETSRKDRWLDIARKSLFSWDLFRRGCMFAVYMPVVLGYSLWIKQLLIRFLCLVFIVAQAAIWPYQSLKYDLQKSNNNQEVRGPVSAGMLKIFRGRNACNWIEFTVLCAMFAISWLSASTSESDDVYSSRGRLVVIHILIWISLIVFFFLLICKFCLLCKRRWLLWKGTRDFTPYTERSRLVNPRA